MWPTLRATGAERQVRAPIRHLCVNRQSLFEQLSPGPRGEKAAAREMKDRPGESRAGAPSSRSIDSKRAEQRQPIIVRIPPEGDARAYSDRRWMSWTTIPISSGFFSHSPRCKVFTVSS